MNIEVCHDTLSRLRSSPRHANGAQGCGMHPLAPSHDPSQSGRLAVDWPLSVRGFVKIALIPQGEGSGASRQTERLGSPEAQSLASMVRKWYIEFHAPRRGTLSTPKRRHITDSHAGWATVGAATAGSLRSSCSRPSMRRRSWAQTFTTNGLACRRLRAGWELRSSCLRVARRRVSAQAPRRCSPPPPPRCALARM